MDPAQRRVAKAFGQRETRPTHKRHAVEVNVQVPVRSSLDSADAFDRPQCGHQFLRDRARRLFEAARELERHGRREVAKLPLWRILDGELWQLIKRDLVQLPENGPESLPHAFVKWKNHEG